MRATFDLIEAAAERGDATAARALEFISAAIGGAFDAARLHDMPQLDGADSCERVAEALAVWIKESAPRAFAEMTGTRYSVTGLDDSADGMERLRDQREFILLAYPGDAKDSFPAELESAWLRDLDSVGREEDFDFDGAALAIRRYVADATESGYLEACLAERRQLAESEPLEEDAGSCDSDWPPFRLYVRDNAPESD